MRYSLERKLFHTFYLVMIISSLGFLFSGCAKSYIQKDIEDITLTTTMEYKVETAMKDFVVVKPVFAQTTLNKTEMLSEKTDSSDVTGSGYSSSSSDHEKLLKIASSGSRIVKRRLLDEAYQASGDAIVNVLIEKEEYCHEESIEEEEESNFDVAALLSVASRRTADRDQCPSKR